MIDFFNYVQENKEMYLSSLLAAIIVVSTIDYLFGWINAKFNSKITFVSSIALYGIIKKMMYFIVLVIFMFVSFLLLPPSVSVPSLSILYTGYLLSELNSVFSHLNLTEDGKKGELFIDFMKRLMGGK